MTFWRSTFLERKPACQREADREEDDHRECDPQPAAETAAHVEASPTRWASASSKAPKSPCSSRSSGRAGARPARSQRASAPATEALLRLGRRWSGRRGSRASGRCSTSPAIAASRRRARRSRASACVGSARADRRAGPERACTHEGGLPAARAQNSWFSPPNTSLTEPSVKMRRIESVRMSAQGSTCTLSGAPGGAGMVSVTTIRSKGPRARFS